MKTPYKHQEPDQIVETSNWVSDALTYEEGAREKSTVFSPNNPEFDFLLPEHRYLSKKSISRAPTQFWVEIAAYRFGCLCGVAVPPAFVSLNGNGECRALIEWFYQDWKSKNTYFSGYALLRSIDSKLDKKRGTRHCLPTLRQGVKSVKDVNNKIISVVDRKIWAKIITFIFKWSPSSILESFDFDTEFLKMFTFDALIGNTDRHHENWGLVYNIDKLKKGQKTPLLSLSPAFDNGTSLGYDYQEDKLATHLRNPAWFDQFANKKKATHHLRKQPDGEQYMHAELIRVLLSERPDLKPVVEDIISFDMKEVRDMLDELTKFVVPVRFTTERAEFSANIIEAKRRSIEAILE